MSRQVNTNSSLDFIFRTPKKLTFSRLYRYYFDFILRLLYRVILIENIPPSVSETFLKLILYTQGKISFFDGVKIDENESKLLALNCSRAAEPTVYYIPRQVLVTNPRLKKSYTLTPGEDCEIVYLSESDKYNLSEINGGLYELISRTATMLADNDISINIAQKNTRLVNLVSGDTQNTVDSIRAVITAMYEGDPTIVVKSSLIDKLQGIPLLQNQSNQNLVQLIEVQQYILSHFYEQIGICTHDQMKRERLITAEINDNLDLAFLNIDDMLESIREGIERVNAMFGMEMTVRLNPIIERQRQRAEEAAAEENPDGEQPGEIQDEPGDQSEEKLPPYWEELTEKIVAAVKGAVDKPEPDEDPEPDEGQPEPDEGQPEPDEGQPEPDEGQPEPDEGQPEPDEDPAIENLDLEVSGDNNIIVIGGDANADHGNEAGAEEVPADS